MDKLKKGKTKKKENVKPSKLKLLSANHNYVNFICFYGSILARLAYFDDTKFANIYANIFGNIIPLDMLHDINNSDDIMDDRITFPGLLGHAGNNSKYVDFNELNMPQRINSIIGESKPIDALTLSQNVPHYLKYISLAWSRYGEVYIIADTRMPDCIWLLFRGTYSNKTAASYTKLSSIIPISVCRPNDKYLLGIFEITVECIHSIISAMNYLASKYLNAGAKIYVTGHSLGAAMGTIFTYLWQHVEKECKNLFSGPVCCLSYGAPRCFNKFVSNKFCNYVANGDIIYKRIVTRGDPVPALPTKHIPGATYSHPCSGKNSILSKITLNCGDTTNYNPFNMRPKYNNNLACKTKKQSTYLALNPIAHANYLNILYLKAIDPVAFLAGFFRWSTREIFPSANGSSICRLIIFNGSVYKAGFYDLANVSHNYKNITEDVYFNTKIINYIIRNTVNISKRGSPPAKLPMDGNNSLIDLSKFNNLKSAINR